MDILGFITQISQDADSAAPGFQARAAYVVLSVALPLVVGLTASAVMWAAERVLGLGGSD